MQAIDTRWFTDTLAAKRLSQRGLGRLLGCNASSVNRLVNGKRPLRLEEAERLATFLGVDVSNVITHAGVSVDRGGRQTRLVGYIDGAGEAHVDWGASGETVPALPDLSDSAVAIQYRTALTPRESMDGWVIYVESPTSSDTIDKAMNRFALVCLDTQITVLGFLRRGYEAGRYNVINFMGPTLENVNVAWATPVLLVRP